MGTITPFAHDYFRKAYDKVRHEELLLSSELVLVLVIFPIMLLKICTVILSCALKLTQTA
jgi:hypothetical protein